MIECLKEGKTEKLKAEIASNANLTHLEPSDPARKFPKIVIYNLEKDVSKDVLSIRLNAQNKCLREGFELKFPIKGNRGSSHWVAKVTPSVLQETAERR